MGDAIPASDACREDGDQYQREGAGQFSSGVFERLHLLNQAPVSMKPPRAQTCKQKN
jgi:hypothetical protein